MADRFTIEINLDGKDNFSSKLSNVNRELGKLEDNASRNAAATRGLGDSMGGLVGNLNNWVAGYGLLQLGQKTLELQRYGAAVDASSRVFTQLVGGTDEANTALERLRANTGGVVDDMTLMRGANSLLLTNLASTAEQAADLTGVAIKLGGAMGQDAATAIENFNAALLNNSYARLDTLGISAARVRQRVEELKEEGLDMSAAFAQATLEQGRAAIERLGDEANTSETAINRLQTRMTNFGQTLAQDIAGQLEIAATSFEQLQAIVDVGLGGTGGIPVLEQRAAMLEDINSQLVVQIENERQLADVMREAENLLTNVPADLYAGATSGSFLSSAIADDGSLYGSSFGASSAGANRQQALSIIDAAGYDSSTLSPESLITVARDLDAVLGAIGITQRENAAATEQSNEALEEFVKTSGDLTDSTQALEKELGDLGELFQSGFVMTAAGVEFFDPEQLANVRIEAEMLMDEYERLNELGTSSEFTLISEVEVERAREIAEQAETIAQDAERFSEAFANASLSELMGITGGGALGDLGDIVLAGIEDEDLRARTERELNVATGRENDLSIAVEEQLAPTIAAIAAAYGPAAAAEAAQRATEAISEGVIAGLSNADIAAQAQQAVGFELRESSAEQISVQSGDSLSAISSRTGYTVEELRMANNGSTLIHPGQILEVGEGTQLVAVAGSVSDIAAGNMFGVDFIDDQLFQNTINERFGVGEQQRVQGTLLGEDMGAQSYDEAVAANFSEDLDGLITSIGDVQLELEEIIMNTDLSPVFSTMKGDLSEVNASINEAEVALTSLSETTYNANIQLSFVIAEGGAAELARSPGFANAIQILAEANGGVLPGTSPTASPSVRGGR